MGLSESLLPKRNLSEKDRLRENRASIYQLVCMNVLVYMRACACVITCVKYRTGENKINVPEDIHS